MTKLEDLIDFARVEPQSHQDMVEMILLMDDTELEIFDRALIGLSGARIEAGMLKTRYERGVH
jgi:hypothetical protein